jgi:hypothetical protein
LAFWRLYSDYEASLRRVYVNFDERKRILRLIVVVAFLALTIWKALSPDFLLTVIGYGKKPGLMSYYVMPPALFWWG